MFPGLVGHLSSTVQRLLQMVGPSKSSSLVSLYQLNSYNRPYVPRGQPKFGQTWGTESYLQGAGQQPHGARGAVQGCWVRGSQPGVKEQGQRALVKLIPSGEAQPLACRKQRAVPGTCSRPWPRATQ